MTGIGPANRTTILDTLIRKLDTRAAKVAVIGLGFAGFPQAIEIAKSGLKVVGIDLDEAKVRRIASGESISPDVPTSELRSLQESGAFSCTTDYRQVREADVVVACLPTPLSPSKEPDLRFVRSAAEGLRGNVRQGQLVLLESTVPPGTTRRLFLPVLEEVGLTPGEDAFLAFAPERIDPGNTKFPLHRIPRLVGGITEGCSKAASAFYRMFVDEVYPVSSPEVAEMSKNVENTFRFVNISFINEVAMVCDRMGVNVWEVLGAASTKPFAFMAHYPGPGVGGHCIPIVPFYLQSVAREQGVPIGIIDAAGAVNDRMPAFVVDKLERELSKRGRGLKQAKVLLLGVTYKPDVPDLRESAALRVLGELISRGVNVRYYDPYAQEVMVDGRRCRSEEDLKVDGVDACLLLTPHKAVDYDALAALKGFVFDAVNALPKNFPVEVVKL